ncbi:Ras-related protein Rab-33 [Aphelenchoides bicaudatus]|nr:Ras-related protein Rab-33 [Aphelenchoides bicaudatus]
MAAQEIQLPPTNLSTSVEIASSPHDPSSSTVQADIVQNTTANTSSNASDVKTTMNTSFPSPGSAIKASSPRTQQYTAKRVFKIIIIGDANVGKTSLSYRFCTGKFPTQLSATIGVDFREKTLVMENELIRVQLWDTAGQERYRQSIVAHYYRNVHAVVLVYDVNSPASFNSLPIWINECKKHVSAANIPYILIGNKCDVSADSGRVKTDIAQTFADKNDLVFFETSALSDSACHIDSILMTLVMKLQQNKSMHVQTEEERASKAQTLLLKANDAKALDDSSEGWCC